MRFLRSPEIQDGGSKMAAVQNYYVLPASYDVIVSLKRTIYPLGFILIALMLKNLNGSE